MKRPMTPRGNAMLRAELHRLKSTRPEIARAIEVARGHGDLSENGDYDAAKEKSGMTEAKIRDLEASLSIAELIDPSRFSTPTRVVFGTSVKIQDVDTGEERVYSIYGAEESDLTKNWISFDAPLAKSLIGKEVGDIAKLTLPGGTKEYEVVEIFVDYEWTDPGTQSASSS